MRLEHADFWTENFSHFESSFAVVTSAAAHSSSFRLHQVEQLLGARGVGELGAGVYDIRVGFFASAPATGMVWFAAMKSFTFCTVQAAIEVMTNEA